MTSAKPSPADRTPRGRWLLVGRLGKPHGLRGAILVKPFNADSPLWARSVMYGVIDAADTGRADTVDAEPVSALTLGDTHIGAKGRWACQFDELRHRDQAERFAGHYLAVPVEALPPLDDADEFYHHEVSGLSVYVGGETLVGTVRSVVDGHVPLLEVRPQGGGDTFLIPMVKAIVERIDRDGGRIDVTPPDGLIPGFGTSV